VGPHVNFTDLIMNLQNKYTSDIYKNDTKLISFIFVL
jgi:hypothetical protein